MRKFRCGEFEEFYNFLQIIQFLSVVRWHLGNPRILNGLWEIPIASHVVYLHVITQQIDLYSSNVCVGTPFFIMPWLMAVVCHVYAGRLWTRTRKIFKTGSEPAGTLKPCRFLYTALECFIISNCSVPYTDSKNIHTTDHLSFMAKTSWLYHNISQIMLSKSIIWTLRLTYNVELSPQLKSGYLCLCTSQWMSWLALYLKPEWGNSVGFNGR